MVMKRSIRRAAALLALLLPGGVGLAQQPGQTSLRPNSGPTSGQTLDLAGAMARGREQAREVAAARSRESAATARLAQARSSHWPVLRVQEIWTRTDSPAEAFALKLNQERFSFPDFVTCDPNDPSCSRHGDHPRRGRGADLDRRRDLEPDRPGPARRRGGRGRQPPWAADSAALAAGEAWVRLAQAREFVPLLEKARETVAAHVELARAYVGAGDAGALRAAAGRGRAGARRRPAAEARGKARVAKANLAFRLGDPISRTRPGSSRRSRRRSPLRARGVGRRRRRPRATSPRRAGSSRPASSRRRSRGRCSSRRSGVSARWDLVDDKLFGTHGDGRPRSWRVASSINLSPGGASKAAVAAARGRGRGRARGRRPLRRGRRPRGQAGVRGGGRRPARGTPPPQRALDAGRRGERITEERFRAGVVKTIDLLDAAPPGARPRPASWSPAPTRTGRRSASRWRPASAPETALPERADPRDLEPAEERTLMNSRKTASLFALAAARRARAHRLRRRHKAGASRHPSRLPSPPRLAKAERASCRRRTELSGTVEPPGKVTAVSSARDGVRHRRPR